MLEKLNELSTTSSAITELSVSFYMNGTVGPGVFIVR